MARMGNIFLCEGLRFNTKFNVVFRDRKSGRKCCIIFVLNEPVSDLLHCQIGQEGAVHCQTEQRDLVGRVIDWLNSSINCISTNFAITALYLINNRLNNFVNTYIAISRNLVINWSNYNQPLHSDLLFIHTFLVVKFLRFLLCLLFLIKIVTVLTKPFSS